MSNNQTRDLLEVSLEEWLEQELANRYGELWEELKEQSADNSE